MRKVEHINSVLYRIVLDRLISIGNLKNFIDDVLRLELKLYFFAEIFDELMVDFLHVEGGIEFDAVLVVLPDHDFVDAVGHAFDDSFVERFVSDRLKSTSTLQIPHIFMYS